MNKTISIYLNKKGDAGLVKTWKKRLFKIEENKIKYYDEKDLKGEIEITENLEIHDDIKKDGTSLYFNLIQSKRYFFYFKILITN
jgi:hypothetical protein